VNGIVRNAARHATKPTGVPDWKKSVPEHRYRIVLSGHIGETFRQAFTGMAVESLDGRTVLIGDLTQGALYILLSRAHALGLELLEAVRVPVAGEDERPP
jgi:hypothetical protein